MVELWVRIDSSLKKKTLEKKKKHFKLKLKEIKLESNIKHKIKYLRVLIIRI